MSRLEAPRPAIRRFRACVSKECGDEQSARFRSRRRLSLRRRLEGRHNGPRTRSIRRRELVRGRMEGRPSSRLGRFLLGDERLQVLGPLERRTPGRIGSHGQSNERAPIRRRISRRKKVPHPRARTRPLNKIAYVHCSHGYGVLTFTSTGEKYAGEWIRDSYDGLGIFHSADGKQEVNNMNKYFFIDIMYYRVVGRMTCL